MLRLVMCAAQADLEGHYCQRSVFRHDDVKMSLRTKISRSAFELDDKRVVAAASVAENVVDWCSLGWR